MDHSADTGRSGPLLGLSERQIECLVLAADGLTSKEIARRIGVAPSTVDNHIRSAAARLQVSSRRDAVRAFLRESAPAVRPDSGDNLLPLKRDSFPDRVSGGEHPWGLPPFGGRPNRLELSRRLMLVLQIALLGTMVLAAITFTITGIVQVLGRR
jgi:DNA-binding CsgD family transcriptional regulator